MQDELDIVKQMYDVADKIAMYAEVWYSLGGEPDAGKLVERLDELSALLKSRMGADK